MLLVRNFFSYVSGFYPEELRRQLRREIPSLTLATSRLALEVLDAETRGLAFGEAALDPSFPLMARVHFGISDTLMERLDARMVLAVRKLATHAASGDFDPLRQLTFALATREGPEGALCRFALWQGIRLNLIIATWRQPMLEVTGCLDSAADEAEVILRDLLTEAAMVEDDVRPFNVLVQAATECLERSVTHYRGAIEKYGAALHEMVRKAEYLQAVRDMDSRSAAALWPGESYEDLGSQRIADRYPHHFPTANAVEAQRSRAKERAFRPASEPRMIDLLLQLQGEAL